MLMGGSRVSFSPPEVKSETYTSGLSADPSHLALKPGFNEGAWHTHLAAILKPFWD